MPLLVQSVIGFLVVCLSDGFNLANTCGDGVCISPEFADNCPLDCGQAVRNPNLLRDLDMLLISWSARPKHLERSMYDFDGRNLTRLVKFMVLNQESIRVRPSTEYDVRIESSAPECAELYIHSDAQILWVGSRNGQWKSLDGLEVVGITVRGLCESNVTQVSISPRPMSSNFGWKYYEIVDSILDDPTRLDPDACRQRCLEDLRCCAWQVCPGTEAEGCGGCYLLGRKPRDSSGERKEGWFGGTERSHPMTPIGVDDCRIFLLSQSAHDKDFYDSSSGKLQKYVNCANIVRADRTVPKQIFVGGVHIPTILVANHRNPDPRLSAAQSMVLPHFYILPFYDTNIGNIMKHTSAMNLVQSYEMQSLLRPGEVFVDAGANLGSYTLSMAEHLGPSGIVLSFEPFRWLFQILNANIAANGFMNCWTYQQALGDVYSRQMLLQPNLRFFSSPGGVRVSNQSVDTQKQMYDTDWGAEPVEVVRLDDVVLTSRAQRVDLIKIDVEGMELNVIKGAMDVIKKFSPIIWVENVAYFETRDTTLLNFLDTNMGYLCWKSLSAGNDLVCEPKDGSKSDRLNRIRKAPLDNHCSP